MLTFDRNPLLPFPPYTLNVGEQTPFSSTSTKQQTKNQSKMAEGQCLVSGLVALLLTMSTMLLEMRTTNQARSDARADRAEWMMGELINILKANTAGAQQ